MGNQMFFLWKFYFETEKKNALAPRPASLNLVAQLLQGAYKVANLVMPSIKLRRMTKDNAKCAQKKKETPFKPRVGHEYVRAVGSSRMEIGEQNEMTGKNKLCTFLSSFNSLSPFQNRAITLWRFAKKAHTLEKPGGL